MAFTSSESIDLSVTNLPGKDLAYTNLAYCSPADLPRFATPGTDLYLAAFPRNSAVLSLAAHGEIASGAIGLNAIQRRYLRISTGDSIPLAKFEPPEDFNLALLTVKLEFLRKGAKEEHIDAALLSHQFKSRLSNQVMTVGQKVTFEYIGNSFIYSHKCRG